MIVLLLSHNPSLPWRVEWEWDGEAYYSQSLEHNIMFIKKLHLRDEILQVPHVMVGHIKCSVLETVILQLRISTVVVLFCAICKYMHRRISFQTVDDLFL